EEKKGRVPDGDWKREKYDQGWYPGDSVNLSIGQGGLQTTPIQIINMVSGIANKGVIYKPSLVDKVLNDQGKVIEDKQPEVKKRLDVDQEAFEILTKGMTEVTHESYGTAGDVFEDYPIKIAGKTGTAQTGSGGYNHGWFVGFAPASDPEIAVLVFLENGNSSSHTLPIAREIFNFYFEIDGEEDDDGAGE
ncbi:MAG: penicillin-binding transpeptidase domain-containing protein, partial [Bacillota bacterium]